VPAAHCWSPVEGEADDTTLEPLFIDGTGVGWDVQAKA
jgi:hypothetical protein